MGDLLVIDPQYTAPMRVCNTCEHTFDLTRCAAFHSRNSRMLTNRLRRDWRRGSAPGTGNPTRTRRIRHRQHPRIKGKGGLPSPAPYLRERIGLSK